MVCVGDTGKQHGTGKCGVGMPMLPPPPVPPTSAAQQGWGGVTSADVKKSVPWLLSLRVT